MASLGGDQHDKNVEEKQQKLKKSDDQSTQGTGQGLQAGQDGKSDTLRSSSSPCTTSSRPFPARPTFPLTKLTLLPRLPRPCARSRWECTPERIRSCWRHP